MKIQRIPKIPRMTYQFFTSIWPEGKKGFYIEIGAWDGRKKNSTFMLEQAGWDGVCVEASPPSYEVLIQNRKCRCLNVAVYDHDGEVDYAMFPDRPEWNGIIETYDELHQKLLESKNPQLKSRESAPAIVQKIPCRSWASLELPNHIDYLQIDTEGSEIPILKCVDWANTTITYICLEDNQAQHGDTTYRDFMISLGYECILQQHVDFLWKKI
jgi:FkbM family methyltransferase